MMRYDIIANRLGRDMGLAYLNRGCSREVLSPRNRIRHCLLYRRVGPMLRTHLWNGKGPRRTVCRLLMRRV